MACVRTWWGVRPHNINKQRPLWTLGVLPRGKKRLVLVLLLLMAGLASYVFPWSKPVELSTAFPRVKTTTRPRANLHPSLLSEYEVENMLTILAYDDPEPKVKVPQPEVPSSAYPPSGSPRFVPASRLVHLDLKGAPPKLSYLRQLLPLLRHLGATGLLLEYEDAFPYWGPLASLASRSAYGMGEVTELLRLARANQLEVVPLVQTFGHLEFALKLPQWRHLRESRAFPQTLCPSHNQSLPTVRLMIDQLVASHPGIARLHLGCDEVLHLGRCGSCLARAAASGSGHSSGPSFLFLEHVRQVAEHVRRRHGLRVLVWDDMFRDLPPGDVLRSRLGGGAVEPVVWAYGSEPIGAEVWRRYAGVFPTVWAAGAFKGASGETAYATDARRHLRNTGSWLDAMRRLRDGGAFEVAGFVLTGWQRYDHFAVLCELLPAAVPSLAVNLLAATHGAHGDAVVRNASVVLGCGERPLASLAADPYLWGFAACSFPGASAFAVVKSLWRVKQSAGAVVRRVALTDGWFNAYSLRHNLTNTWRVRGERQKVQMALRAVRAVRKNAIVALAAYLEGDAVAEWVQQQIDPLMNVLAFIDAKIRDIVKVDTWPRRPEK